jgi:hypothetical protein
MKKTIAIIGTPGATESGIAESLAKAGHHVLLSDNKTKRTALMMRSLRRLFRRKSVTAPQTGVEVIPCIKEASWEADIILLAAPAEAHTRIATKITDVVTGKVIVSMVNSINGTNDDSTVSAAEKLAQLLPHARVVSAFNTTLAPNFRKTRIAGQITDVFVAGDDEEAVSTAMQLVMDAGFNPISAGKLVMSRTLERMTALQTIISARHNYREPLGWKVLHE